MHDVVVLVRRIHIFWVVQNSGDRPTVGSDNSPYQVRFLTSVVIGIIPVLQRTVYTFNDIFHNRTGLYCVYLVRNILRFYHDPSTVRITG